MTGAVPAVSVAQRARTGAVRMMAARTVDEATAVEADDATDLAAAPLRERAATRVEVLLDEAAEALLATADEGGSATGANGAAGANGALRAATASLESGLIEREAEARLLLLALVGGEHLLLLGPPARPVELCRRLKTSPSSYFERTFTRFGTPEEPSGRSLSARA